MKKFLTLIALGGVLALTPASLAQAACGIGSTIWEGKDGTGAKVLASLTNFWTLKGISTTFGLAGCTDADNLLTDSPAARVHHFASNNLDRLVRDMARGRGEHLDDFATLMRVRAEHRPDFQAFTKRNIAILYSHDDMTVDELLATLDRLMADDEKLSDYVRS